MSTRTPQIHGRVAEGFGAVRDAFVANFEHRGDVGASVAVYVDGLPVVDLWGGLADPVEGREWAHDTTTLVYSATKGATAVLANMLIARGLLHLDAPVADYWPEFGAAGKEGITVGMLLSHRAGLPTVAPALTRDELFAVTPVVDALAAQTPEWEPDTQHGYHALTFGWLVGELLRRVTGESLGTTFRTEIAEPLNIDFWIGLKGARPDLAPLINGTFDPGAIERIKDPQVRTAVLQLIGAMSDPTSLLARALSTNGALPTPDADTWNDLAALDTEQPGANGITNARGLARLYGATVAEVDGVRLLSDASVEEARRERSSGPDLVTMGPSRFGAGFTIPHPGLPMLGPTSFGTQGAGGALGFADVEARVGFGYAQNQLSSSLEGEPRTDALVAALRTSLDTRSRAAAVSR